MYGVATRSLGAASILETTSEWNSREHTNPAFHTHVKYCEGIRSISCTKATSSPTSTIVNVSLK